MDKSTLIGVGGMLVGAALVVFGLSQIPVLAAVLIIAGGAAGILGYKVFKGDIRV